MFSREMFLKNYADFDSFDDKFYEYYNKVLNEDKIKQEFDKFDKSGDDCLTKEEVKQMLLVEIDEALKKYGDTDTLKTFYTRKKEDIDGEVKGYFKKTDKNKDQKITFKEFLEQKKSSEIKYLTLITEDHYDILDLLKQLKDSMNDFFKTVDIDRLTARIKRFCDEESLNDLEVHYADLMCLFRWVAEEERIDDYELINYYYFCKLYLECKTNLSEGIFTDTEKRKLLHNPEENIKEMKEILVPIAEKIFQDFQEYKKEK